MQIVNSLLWDLQDIVYQPRARGFVASKKVTTALYNGVSRGVVRTGKTGFDVGSSRL